MNNVYGSSFILGIIRFIRVFQGLGLYHSHKIIPLLQTPMKHTKDYRQTSNISLTLVGNKIVDHSDVVGASPVCAASTTSSFST